MELLTIQEAMARLNISRQALYVAMDAGKLTAHRLYGKTLLDAAEIANYKPNNYKDKRRPALGRPRKQVTEDGPAKSVND